jgi:hypothetical protein
MAVCVAVCGSVHDSVRAVRVIVCISALGNVWQCAHECVALSISAAVCGSVRQCAAVCGSVRQCVAACGSVC